jgi:hypothetical protein
MILRRFKQHIQVQNWFAVGLDVLVVITGIFLGMQVTEWNENRKNSIDGQDFIKRIHGEILVAEDTSSRVRERRLNLIKPLREAVTTIFDDKATVLKQDQCLALATSHYFNIAISDLPSLTELMSVGRVSIIEKNELRTALIEFQQKLGTLKENIRNAFIMGHNLAANQPNLIRAEPYYDEELGEMQSRYKCDIGSMKKNQQFLNTASENVDVYDAYLRDGLRPWSTHMTYLHKMLDETLGIDHASIL